MTLLNKKKKKLQLKLCKEIISVLGMYYENQNIIFFSIYNQNFLDYLLNSLTINK